MMVNYVQDLHTPRGRHSEDQHIQVSVGCTQRLTSCGTHTVLREGCTLSSARAGLVITAASVSADTKREG